MTLENSDILQKFATDHDCLLVLKGEVGMGRPCVGFTRGKGYVDTAPYDMTTFEPLPGFGDEVGEMAPANAYHKHPCLAVLVEDDDYEAGLAELREWVGAMNEAGVEVVEFDRGPMNPMQAMLSGQKGFGIRVAG